MGEGERYWDGQRYWEPVPPSRAPPPPVTTIKRRPPPQYDEVPLLPPTEEEVDQFLEAWGLDEQCALSLKEQPLDVQRHAIDRFKPKGDTKDITSLFKGFLKSFVFGPG